jgi:hypothetical protein
LLRYLSPKIEIQREKKVSNFVSVGCVGRRYRKKIIS